VSNWRRRHADFPSPVAGTDRNPRFDLARIEEWLRQQGRAIAISPGQRLWQALDSIRDSVPVDDALAAVGVLLLHLQQHPTDAIEADAARLGLIVAEAAARFAPWAEPITSSRLGGVLVAASEASQQVEPAQLFDELYARFLGTASRAGFTATPPELAELMVRLAGRTHGALLDPACGTGSILLAAAAHGFQRLYGQELQPSIARLAALRLALGARDGPVVAVHPGDTLREPVPRTDPLVDAVVTNPPFADRSWGYDELATNLSWEYGVPSRLESELAWAQYALAQVAPGGMVVILMPPAVAVRPSGRRTRRALLTRGALRAVIALPAGLATHYALALQIWILQRPDESTAPSRLLIIDTAAQSTPDAEPADVWARIRGLVTTSWQHFVADPETFPDEAGVAGAVSLIDLLDEEVDLTPSRALPAPPSQVASSAEISRTSKELHRLLVGLVETVPSADPLPGPTGDPVRTVALGDLAKNGAAFIRRTSRAGAADEGPTLEVRILTGSDVVDGAPPSGVGLVDDDQVRNPPIRVGDVLTPVVAQRLVARVATDEDAGAYPSPGVCLVRTDPDVLDPWYLASYLSSNDGARQAPRVGSSLGGETRIDLRRVRVPLLPIEAQRRRGQLFAQLSEFLRTLRAANRLGQQLSREYGEALTATINPHPPRTEEQPTRETLAARDDYGTRSKGPS
jgi:hypothetical protein